MIGENARRILRRDPHPHLFRPLALRTVTLHAAVAWPLQCERTDIC